MKNLIKLLTWIWICIPFQVFGISALPGVVMKVAGTEKTRQAAKVRPVHITLFSVSYDARKDVVNLHWVTGAVEAGDQFLIERSADSVHFVKIGETKSTVSTKAPQHYYFDDTRPLSGRFYYRLHLIGADGSNSYISATGVYKEILKMELSSLVRDTASKTLFFSIASPKESNANITLVDYAGKVIKSYFIPLKKGSNFQSAYVGNLSPGIYFLQVNDKNGGGSVMQQFSND